MCVYMCIYIYIYVHTHELPGAQGAQAGGAQAAGARAEGRGQNWLRLNKDIKVWAVDLDAVKGVQAK